MSGRPLICDLRHCPNPPAHIITVGGVEKPMCHEHARALVALRGSLRFSIRPILGKTPAR